MSELSSFGFEYECDGSKFSFAVVAMSEDEAKRRVKAMSQSQFVGVLVAQPHERPVKKVAEVDHTVTSRAWLSQSNAGVQCDNEDGPCACGAWH